MKRLLLMLIVVAGGHGAVFAQIGVVEVLNTDPLQIGEWIAVAGHRIEQTITWVESAQRAVRSLELAQQAGQTLSEGDWESFWEASELMGQSISEMNSSFQIAALNSDAFADIAALSAVVSESYSDTLQYATTVRRGAHAIRGAVTSVGATLANAAGETSVLQTVGQSLDQMNVGLSAMSSILDATLAWEVFEQQQREAAAAQALAANCIIHNDYSGEPDIAAMEECQKRQEEILTGGISAQQIDALFRGQPVNIGDSWGDPNDALE